jgi:hypothetical protein
MNAQINPQQSYAPAKILEFTPKQKTVGEQIANLHRILIDGTGIAQKMASAANRFNCLASEEKKLVLFCAQVRRLMFDNFTGGGIKRENPLLWSFDRFNEKEQESIYNAMRRIVLIAEKCKG